jgi:hypothetical protein
LPVHRGRTIDAGQGNSSNNPAVGDRDEAVSQANALARHVNGLIDTGAVEALVPKRRERVAQETR